MGSGLWPETEESLAPASLFVRNVAIRAHVEYQRDPVRWAVDKLGIPEHALRWHLCPGYARHTWDGSVDPLASAFEAISDWNDVAIESATGVGKSFGAAILILWFLASWENAQVWTFALTADQLKDYIWRNITELWPRFSAHFPTAELSTLTLRMRGGIDGTWAAQGKGVQLRAGETVASRAQGMHNENMLLVYEEAAAMEWAIIEAGRQTCTRPHNLRLFIGNPTSQTDTLHRVSKQHGVVALRASALDHPNVVGGDPDLIPGTISQVKIDARLADCDGNAEDPLYLSRVRGVSPEQASNALIRLEWLKSSADRWRVRKAETARLQAGGMVEHDASVGVLAAFETRSANGPVVSYGKVATKHILPIGSTVTGKGVDAANSEHGDRAAICDFSGNAVVRLVAFQCPDSNALGRQVKLEMEASSLDANRVGVDATGVGAGCVNELRRLRAPVVAIYFGSPATMMSEKLPDGRKHEWAPDVNLFASAGGLRSQMYWQLREDLRHGVIDIPEDIELWEELTAPTFVDYPKTVVEPKDEIKPRLGRSPDKAEALVIANWVRARAFVAPVVEQQQAKSLGWDPRSGKPVERETGQAAFDRMIQKAQGNPRSGRMRVPRAKP